jgi:hypothetical protein
LWNALLRTHWYWRRQGWLVKLGLVQLNALLLGLAQLRSVPLNVLRQGLLRRLSCGLLSWRRMSLVQLGLVRQDLFRRLGRCDRWQRDLL